MIRGALRPLIRGGLRGIIPGVSDEFQALIDSLFGNGEQGLLFVPEPGFRGEDVLYQDAAGTTLADANGDPVGLGLEWSKGLELGPELVTNGTFDTDSAWTKGPSWTISGGVASSDGTQTSFSNLEQTALTVGRYYEITFTIVEIGAGDSLLVGSSNSLKSYNSAGQFTQTFKAVSDGEITFAADSGVSCTVDNVSVKELPGNHLSQSDSAKRPLYQTDGTLHWLTHDQSDDALVASLPDLGTNATLAYANAAGVTILEGQTISGDTIIPQEVELYGVIYLDRPFTASEATQVTDYLNKRRGA